MNPVFLSAFGLGLWLFCLISPASAQTPEIRVITQTSATSDCIGESKTPLCAVETFVACWARQIAAICLPVLAEGNTSAPFGMPPYTLEYIIMRQTTLTKSEIRRELSGNYRHATDVVRIDLQSRKCAPTLKSCPDTPWYTNAEYAAKYGEEWKIVIPHMDLNSDARD